jgi:hypothetical protein
MSVVMRAIAQRMRVRAVSEAPELVSRRAIVFAPSRGGSVVVSAAA